MAFGSILRRPGRLVLALGVMGLTACEQALPTSSEVPSPSGPVSTVTGGAARASADGNGRPNAVFKTRPAATADNVIAGGSVFDVTFNMCPSTDSDPGDELKFTYDFDGDGTVDEFGHCRATHRYYAADFAQECQPAVVCVGDRHPDHAVCQTYSVCGGLRDEKAPATESNSQTVTGSHGPFQWDMYSFTATAGTQVNVVGDTLSAATAYDLIIYVTSTPDPSGVFGWGDDEWACTFPPPIFGCPDFGFTVPADGTYYLVMTHAANDFAGEIGEYTATVTSDAPIGILTLIGDNQTGASSLDAPVALSGDAGVPASLAALREKRAGRLGAKTLR